MSSLTNTLFNFLLFYEQSTVPVPGTPGENVTMRQRWENMNTISSATQMSGENIIGVHNRVKILYVTGRMWPYKHRDQTIPHPHWHLQSQWEGNTEFQQCSVGAASRPDQDNWHTSQITFAKQWWMFQCWLLVETQPAANIQNVYHLRAKKKKKTIDVPIFHE